ncbi:hypothetical protein COOONC_18803 [Cooperia oncophora]
MLMSLRPLNHTIRSVYDVPVIAQPENGRPSTQRVVNLSAVYRLHAMLHIEMPVHSSTFERNPGRSGEIDLNPRTFGSKSECAPKDNELFEMLADCHITVKQPIDPTGIKATINGADSDIEL